MKKSPTYIKTRALYSRNSLKDLVLLSHLSHFGLAQMGLAYKGTSNVLKSLKECPAKFCKKGDTKHFHATYG